MYDFQGSRIATYASRGYSYWRRQLVAPAAASRTAAVAAEMRMPRCIRESASYSRPCGTRKPRSRASWP